MTIDLEQYPEVCWECRMPARSDAISDERIGVESYQFCINPECINWDGNSLKRQRDLLAKAIRETKSFRRHRIKLWKQEILAHRATTNHSTAGNLLPKT